MSTAGLQEEQLNETLVNKGYVKLYYLGFVID